MTKIRALALAIGAVLVTAAVTAAASTPGRQFMFGPGSGFTATAALPAGDSGSDFVVDTVYTRTAGKLLDIRNNGTSKASFDFNGVLTVPGWTSTGATIFTGAVTHSANANAFDLSAGTGAFKTTTGAVTIGGATSFSVAAPVSVATTGTAASTAFSAAGQAGGASAAGATNNTGGAGSADALASGAGGVASGAATGTNTGGAGGTLQTISGAGGASSGATTANVGGAGGAGTFGGGVGGAVSGAGTTNTGGAGGAATLSSGVGGASAGGTTNVGGAGGALAVTAGTGGNGTQTGGAGGSISVTAGSAGTGGNAAAGNITLTPGAATGSGAGGSVTISTATAVARAGYRNASTRNIVRNATAVTDCAAGNLTPTVAAIVDGTIYTCATAQTLTLPTAQGASGIVQNLPGTPAVGDIFQIKMAENHATNTFTLIAGTGGTIYGIATITNGSRTWDCRITAITGGSETYTCY